MFDDMTFFLYVYIGVISLWGLILFMLGLQRADKVAPMYAYILLWFAGETIRMAITAYGRYLFKTDSGGQLLVYLDSTIWTVRLWIPACVLSMIVFHMTWRYIRNSNWFIRRYRKTGDDEDHKEYMV